MSGTTGEDKCWFCGKRPAQSNTSVQVKLSQVRGRSSLGTARRVDYAVQKITIPRCSSCKSLHDKASLLKWASIFLMIASGIGLTCVMIQIEAPTWICWAAPITGVIIAAFVGAYLHQKYGFSPDVKDISKKNEYPPIAALMKEDWLDGTPMP